MALDAGWDDELLAVEMEELQNLGFDLGLTGFDEKEIADLFDTNGSDDVKDDDFDLTTALEKAAFVQRGDIWTVGRHRLMCGDATSSEDVSALMGETKANLILTDPPYGVSFKSSSGLTIQNDSMKNEEFYNFLLSAFKCMADHLEKGGSAYVFHADTEGLNFRKAFIDAGFHLAGCCIWVKDSLVPVSYTHLREKAVLRDYNLWTFERIWKAQRHKRRWCTGDAHMEKYYYYIGRASIVKRKFK